jgi:hypothetical protein
MSNINIKLKKDIYAEIIGESSMLSNSSMILDPITNSYSELGNLEYYSLKVAELSGVYDPVLLENGKNSRFSVSGKGKVVIELLIRDDKGNTATDIITIKVI